MVIAVLPAGGEDHLPLLVPTDSSPPPCTPTKVLGSTGWALVILGSFFVSDPLDFWNAPGREVLLPSPPALQVATAEALQADDAVPLLAVGLSLPVAPPGSLQVHSCLCPLQCTAHTVSTPAGLDGQGSSSHLHEAPAFQHHPEPSLQQQDPAQDLTMQPLLQGLPLCLLQEDLWAGTGERQCACRASQKPPCQEL